MERKLADLTPALLDLAFYANKIAFAQLLEDLRTHLEIARHAKHPSNTQTSARSLKHRRDRKRQFIRRSRQHAADRAGE